MARQPLRMCSCSPSEWPSSGRYRGEYEMDMLMSISPAFSVHAATKSTFPTPSGDASCHATLLKPD